MRTKNIRPLISIALIGIMLFVSLFQLFTPNAMSKQVREDLPAGFVHAKAGEPRLVVGPSETPILLTGVNFPAVGWYDDESESIDNVLNARDFRQEDYDRVAAMGMNVVRLAVWYKLFKETDGTYNQATGSAPGWAWLDNQIQMAKNSGVYIGLSLMRVEPQGYADSTFFSSTTAKNNMKSLWQQFAARYKDETQIAYYDLLNEPTPNNPSSWHSYAQELVNAIRAIDTNHLLDIQVDLNTGTPFTITDPQNNVMYDSHFYEPYYYTATFVRRGWQGQYQTTSANPWPIPPWDSDITWDTATGSLLPSSPTGTFDWTQYETSTFTPSTAQYIVAEPVFVAPSGGTMYFDDFQLIEVAPDSSEQVLETVDLEDADTGYPADAPYKIYRAQLTRIGGSGSATADTANKRSGLASIRFPANSKFTSVRLTFPARQGYSYKIRGWLKGDSVTGSGGFGVRWGDWTYGTSDPFTKATLQDRMLDVSGDYIFTYYRNLNIPVDAGEWGLSPYSFAEKPGYYISAGGLDYVRDVLDLYQQNQINSTYWVYSRFNNYYIYRNCPPFTTTCEWPGPGNANQPLVDLFTEILTDPTLSITSTASNPTSVSPIPVTFTFDKTVTGFTAGDVTVTNGTLSNFSGSGATYTADVTPSASGLVTVSVPAGAAQDAYGNGNAAATFSITYVASSDTTPPQVTSIVRAGPNPTNAASVNFTVTFSEPVTGVDASDFSLTTTGGISGASVAGISGSGATYTVSVATGTGNGTIRLDLNASGTGIQDLAGNPIAGGFTGGEIYEIVEGYSLYLPIVLK